jgi:DNA-binding transcriptional ArsR family regulator
MPAALAVVDRPEQVAALCDPLRLRILAGLREPGSATTVARQLAMPRQKINYHLRELEKAGLVEAVEERRKGGCVERVVRATATSYLIGPAALGALAGDPTRVRDRFSAAYLMSLAARTIREVATLERAADRRGQRLATLSLEADVRFASAADRQAFAEELAAAVAGLVAKYHREDAPDGRLFRLTVGAHPAITKPFDEDPQPEDPSDGGRDGDGRAQAEN